MIYKSNLPFKRKNKKYIFFNILFFSFMALPLIVVGSFNMIIDPYGVYDEKFVVYGLNHHKPNKENNDRLYKAIEIIHLKPNTILLGSSRMKRALDPNHPSLQTFAPVYNLGLNGANIYELRRYVEHTLVNNPNLQRVILGLDFFMFNANLDNQPSFTESRLEKKHIVFEDFLNTLLSLDTLEASQETIEASVEGSENEEALSQQGFLPYFKKEDGNTTIRFEGSTKLYFKLHHDYKLSEEYIHEFQKIVDLCQKHNVELIIYFSPAHAIRLESIYASGKWSVLEDWKRRMVSIAPVWDFFNYNSITTEPLSETMNNYVDDSHYIKPIGDLVVNRVLGNEEKKEFDDFGLLLTPKNIDNVLDKDRINREIWAKNNRQAVDFVNSIKLDVLASLESQNR
ncbi:hypothetical protein [Roseofilum sp. Guam]|uniref:hypothetical protein n=1 Tax=Roseofilum sp. Guam TaxID=2821502 RepID=UPI001B02295A|nr:hypothetical protein [Roseofilum sp. Guam]MBP0028550.1 hypothetical protein [Roseofilum sp. Guam]